MRFGTSALIGIWLAAVLGCAGTGRSYQRPPKLSRQEIRASTAELGSETISNLVELRTRMKNVEYRLVTASARHCGELARPRLGAIFSSRKSFEHEVLQGVAHREYAIGDRLTVVYVVPEGPLDRARFEPGDQILKVNGEMFRTANDLGDFLLEHSDLKSVRIRFRRGDAVRETLVQLASACPVFFSIAASPMIVAWQNSRLLVAVSVGLLNYVESDDELAVALSHQVAHALFDQQGDSTVEEETRADFEGLRIAAIAGYDVSSALEYWESVAREYPWLIDLESGIGGLPWSGYDEFPHHGIAQRMRAIRSRVRAIEANLASSQTESSATRKSDSGSD